MSLPTSLKMGWKATEVRNAALSFKRLLTAYRARPYRVSPGTLRRSGMTLTVAARAAAREALNLLGRDS